MILVTGTAFSGKTTIKNRLKGKLNLSEVRKYSTKKASIIDMVSGRLECISEDEFKALEAKGFFAWISRDDEGNYYGVSVEDFKDDSKIMEMDFPTYKTIEKQIPRDAKVVFVDANINVRFERMLRRGADPLFTFFQIHNDNFRDTGMVFGVKVDNSHADHGESATNNAAYAIANEYKEYGVVYAKRIPPSSRTIERTTKSESTAKMAKFLEYENWALTQIRDICSMENETGRALARKMYRDYLLEYTGLSETPVDFDTYGNDIMITIDGIQYPLIRGDKPAEKPQVMSLRRKSPKD